MESDGLRIPGRTRAIAPRTAPTLTSTPPVGLASPGSASSIAASPATIAVTPIVPRAMAVPLSRFSIGGTLSLTAVPGPALTLGFMPIEIDIAHVARLARLGLSADELEAYRAQLGVILEHAARVQSLDVEPGVEAAHPLGMENAFRDDVVRPSLSRDEVLAQAPDAHDGQFVAPPAMEDAR